MSRVAVSGYFVIYQEGAHAKVATTRSISERIGWGGLEFTDSGYSLGDFNHLLNQAGDLVGFEFPFCEVWFEGIPRGGLLKDGRNVRYENGCLQVILEASGPFASDCCLALGSSVYVAGSREHLICIPDVKSSGEQWAELWKRTAFDMVSLEEKTPL